MNTQNNSIETENETIYINNINEKIEINTLKETLNNIFSTYGRILSINIKKTYQMKGQSFITYDSIESATNAIKSMNGKYIFGKQMKISYAKSKSDVTLKEKECFSVEEYQKRLEVNRQKRDVYYKRLLSNKRIGGNSVVYIKREKNIASNKLLVENISEETTKEDLLVLFNKTNGFKGLVYIKEKNVCFVEYDDENNAASSLIANNKLYVNGRRVNISFANV